MFSIERMCRVLKISRSSYYRWLNHGPSKRAIEHSLFTTLIKDAFELSKGTYGAIRIAEELKREKYCISRRRVSKIMKENGLVSKHKRKFKVTTDTQHNYPICRNLLDQNFVVDRLNQIWISDITYIPTKKGWMYLTTVIDLYDRQVIGWSLSKSLHTGETIVPAWKMACDKRKITESLLFHSDRGIQYASREFKSLLKSNDLITQSMSRKANCWDNAVAESFFKTLKVELVYDYEFESIEEAKSKVFEWIEIWYNRKRLHSSLGYKTPYEVEQEFYRKINLAA